MKSEAIAYVVAGMAFGTILGWVIGTQQVRRAPAAAETAPPSTQTAAGSTRPAPTLDQALLNKGIVLAFGKQDLRGAQAEWEKVVSLAPNSPEGQAAKRALEGIASAHASGTNPSNQ